MPVLVHAIDHPELPPFVMPDRFRHEVAYFMDARTDPDRPGAAAGEYWLDLAQAQRWYDDGAIRLVSPLDSQNQTEVELSEEQESWLAWVLENRISHIRLA
ncbi:MAG TPA: hypothetical protein VHD36_09135 [Pirellulales bacterium]|nr:hypothetical protein [Pirellulales bacterium]